MDDGREKSNKVKMCKYKILRISHSGRKDIRYKDVDDPKYDGLIGSIIKMKDIESTELFERLKWDFVETSSWYDWWEASEIISVFVNFKNQYVVETVNTIYVLEKLKDERDQNESDG